MTRPEPAIRGWKRGAGHQLTSRARVLVLVSLSAWSITAAAPAGNWPSFRGLHAAGVADGMQIPDRWDGAGGTNIRWKRPIPGLAHSSPVVWGQRLFVTTAISSQGEATFKHGLFGEGDASKDQSSQQWKVLCLDIRDGKVLWEALAY